VSLLLLFVGAGGGVAPPPVTGGGGPGLPFTGRRHTPPLTQAELTLILAALDLI
jgi:hypothetical protein